MKKMREHFRKALINIIRHGDTDIFPFPFERYLFEEKQNEVLDILVAMDKNFKDSISFKIDNIVQSSQIGYFGFRRATLIEPFWNAFYLGKVISIADKIETARLPLSDESVFSYRFNWNEETGSLFADTKWSDYKKKCVELSKKFDYVLQTDISDFYLRVNHHRLDNILIRLDEGGQIKYRIMRILGNFSDNISYGLPIGGPASRILSELSLIDIDKLLKVKGFTFCRYADDYTFFCDTEAECYKTLIVLNNNLSKEQLVLQKSKTRIISSKEFKEIHQAFDPTDDASEGISEEQKLLNISIRFDPYSATAVEDFENLKNEIQGIDIIGILSREVNKSSIDQTVTKQAINSIKALGRKERKAAIELLIDEKNLITLSPVFPTIMRCVRGIYEDLDKNVQIAIDKTLIGLFLKNSYLTKIEINVNFLIQVLSIRHAVEKEVLFIKLFDETQDFFLKRQIIIAMSNWNCQFWISNIKNSFSSMSIWERRAFIYASYCLGDEGKFWRDKYKYQFSAEEKLIHQWFAERSKANKKILV